MLTNSTDRRSYDRIDHDFKAKIQEVDLYQELKLTRRKKELDARILNISASGALISAPQLFSEKTIVKIDIDMPEWQKHTGSFFSHDVVLPSPPMTITAEVVRSKKPSSGDKTFAVRFVGLDGIRLRAINNMVKEFTRRKSFRIS
ncbi:MAG: PilZ domain-containing protein [Candidatus Auribacterota bacterium]|jgi:c-di-GMP-binding flagellar brake protein YcgR|nr:PilZ domain-containing protein [Candidatus Auribacterota bacterium]